MRGASDCQTLGVLNLLLPFFLDPDLNWVKGKERGIWFPNFNKKEK